MSKSNKKHVDKQMLLDTVGRCEAVPESSGQSRRARSTKLHASSSHNCLQPQQLRHTGHMDHEPSRTGSMNKHDITTSGFISNNTQKRSHSAKDLKSDQTFAQSTSPAVLPWNGHMQPLRHNVSEQQWNSSLRWQSSPRSLDDFSITAPSDSSDRDASTLSTSDQSHLASLAPQSKSDNILLSKYDVDNIWALKELYADLEEAQDEEQFLFDAGRLEDFQWNPWEDWGIQNKQLSTQQLQSMFEKGLNQNTQASLSKLYRGIDVDFRREMSFRKLYERYKHLDEETRRQKILDEWGWQSHRSRRSSDSSSMFSCGGSSMTGTYLEIMEKAAQKARQRALYGYHIPEEYNSYEKHVQRMRKLTRSCPDINRLMKDKGKRSTVRETSHLTHNHLPQNNEVHQKSDSKHKSSPRFRKTDRAKDDLDCTKMAKSRTKISDLLRLELGEVSGFGTDGQNEIKKLNETTPPWKSQKTGERGAIKASENFENIGHACQPSQKSFEKGDSGLNMSWDNSFELEEPSLSCKRQSRTRSLGKSAWRSEVRGVVGVPMQSVNAVEKKMDSPKRSESLDQKLQNFREKHGWRKDSKPDPGTVSRALNVFQAMKEEEILPQYYEPLVGEGNPSLARRRMEAENEALHLQKCKDSDPGTASRAQHVFQAMKEEEILPQCYEPLVGDGNPSLARRRMEAENEAMHLKRHKDSKPDPGTISRVLNVFQSMEEEEILPQYCQPLVGDGNPSLARRRMEAENEALHLQHHEDSHSIHHQFQRSKSLSAKHDRILQQPIRSPSSRNHLHSYKSEPELFGKSAIKSDAFLWARNRFEEMSTEGESAYYPKTGLPTKSQKTALGRYEARIRGRSETGSSVQPSESVRDVKCKSLEYDRFQEELGKHTSNTDELSTASWKSKETSLEQHIRLRVDMSKASLTDSPSQLSSDPKGRDSPDWDEPESPPDGRISRLEKREDDVNSCDFDHELTTVKRPFNVTLTSASSRDRDVYSDYNAESNKELVLVRCLQNKQQSALSQNSPGMYETDLDTTTSQSFVRHDNMDHVDQSYMDMHGWNADPDEAKKMCQSLNRQQFRDRTKMAVIPPNRFGEYTPVIHTEVPTHTGQSPDVSTSMKSSQRSFSTSVLTTDHIITDANYGDLSKWSRVNVTEGLERHEDDLGQLQKWGPTCLNIATMSSNETFIIKDSDQEMSPGEGSRSFSGRLPSQYKEEPLSKSHDVMPGTGISAAPVTPLRNFKDIKQDFAGDFRSTNRSRGQDKPESSVKPIGIPFRRKVNNVRSLDLNEEPTCYTWKREYDVPPNIDIDEVRRSGIRKGSDLYKSLAVIRNFTKEAGPQDFYDDLEQLGKEWKRDADKKQTRQSAPPFPHQYRREEGIENSSLPLPEYRPPPCYVHPWLEQQPECQPIQVLHRDRNKDPQIVGPQPAYTCPSNITFAEQRGTECSIPQSKSCPENISNNGRGHKGSDTSHAFSLAAPQSQSSQQVSHLSLANTYGMQNQMEKHHGDMNPTNKSDDEEGDARTGIGGTILPSRQKHARSKSSSSIIRSNLSSQSAMERLGIKSPPPGGLANTLKEHAHTTTQSNVPRQRHSVSGTGRSPTGSWDSRRRRDEEAARRKQEMKRITAQEKLKRMEEERKANEARRHNDFLTEYIKDKLDDKYWLKLAGVEHEDESSPSQKSPIPLNRYDDVPDVSDLQRPKKKVGAQYRGKARALYNFKAQNPKELSFKKNDVIYLLRQIDKNWYEGEHHGLVGLFPVNYVEVLMSLDEARQAAILREGHAKAKYHFTAQSGMEISFRKGDTVSLIRRIDNNWFEGRVDGRHGIFPVSYVEVLREPDTPLPTPMSSYAPTPATGSPGQLSPVSTISNGPAPTIPSAPISPRSSVDNFDFGQPFSFSQYPSSSSASLQRPSRREQSYSDYGLDPLNMMRPASALGGLTDGYSTVPRDRYNPANRPNSAVPFSSYLKNSARDSGFYSSEESKYSRQKYREDELMRSLSNPYEARQSSVGSQSRDSFSRGEEQRYPPFQALYTYKPQNPDELELREGDIVYVMEKCDDDWYVGTSQRTKEFGTFPGNYVRQLWCDAERDELTWSQMGGRAGQGRASSIPGKISPVEQVDTISDEEREKPLRSCVRPRRPKRRNYCVANTVVVVNPRANTEDTNPDDTPSTTEPPRVD
ncbi:hypothetical protein LSH36_129g05064 [Paralvinella palmiformis]|uniref:SH3 domain-containing protein n=1 Tax=Paralvinella palmiformis TaxID=53620 RepID=A0AAD9JWG8_9ANNE|nr:hypothetical protein LSH36_129g05064 [Paralvinella palmiformis]